MKKAERLTTSWKIPTPGDVINYAFLWNHEATRGQTEGLKDRPCVVVVSVTQEATGLNVIVCPLTSQTPVQGTTVVEIPTNVKNRLGLTDREKSFAITSEINTFLWPGPDLRPFERNGTKDIYFGRIPQRLHAQIKDGILSHAKARKLKTTSRN